MRERGESRRSRLYARDIQASVRLGIYEYAMLRGLMKHWNTNFSEAIRRAIVYTYSKFVTKREGLSEEDLREALRIALSSLPPEDLSTKRI